MKKFLRLVVFAALLATSLPSFAAIAVGASVWTAGAGGNTGMTSGAITTQASGSTFVVFVGFKNTASFAAPTILNDNKSNTFTLARSVNGIGSLGQSVYYCINCAGGAGHTITVAWAANVDSEAIAFVEFTGVGAGTFDVAPTGVSDTAASPIVAPSITTSVANELIVNAFISFSSNTQTITHSGSGFTIILSQPANTSANGAVSWANPGSSGTASGDTFAYTTFDYTAALAIGIKPFSAATCTHTNWQSAGSFATPNGTTGSYWNCATGAFSTPNCSTGSFWNSAGGCAAN